jgi:hypothetical protein
VGEVDISHLPIKAGALVGYRSFLRAVVEGIIA